MRWVLPWPGAWQFLFLCRHLELQCVAGLPFSSQHTRTEELHGHEILRADTSKGSLIISIQFSTAYIQWGDTSLLGETDNTSKMQKTMLNHRVKLFLLTFNSTEMTHCDEHANRHKISATITRLSVMCLSSELSVQMVIQDKPCCGNKALSPNKMGPLFDCSPVMGCWNQ